MSLLIVFRVNMTPCTIILEMPCSVLLDDVCFS